MGFFDFFKSKKKEQEKIEFSKIDEYLENYDKKHDSDKIISELNEKITVYIEEAKKHLDELETEMLRNENIPERAKHIMQGNRRNFIQKNTRFLDSLNLPKKRTEILEFSKQVTKDLDTLSAETQRSFMVLKEFMEKKMSQVVIAIKNIEEESRTVAKKLEDVYGVPDKVRIKLNDYKDAILKQTELKKILKEKKLELNQQQDKIIKITEKISNIKKGKSYIECNKLKKEEKNNSDVLLLEKKNVHRIFQALERPLRKYQHISIHKDLIDKYLKEDFESLINDETLEIAKVFESMNKQLSKLGLKDIQEQKAKVELNEITKEKLVEIKSSIQAKIASAKEIRMKLLQNDSAMKLSEQESILKKTNDLVKFISEEIKNLQAKIIVDTQEKIKDEIISIMTEMDVQVE